MNEIPSGPLEDRRKSSAAGRQIWIKFAIVRVARRTVIQLQMCYKRSVLSLSLSSLTPDSDYVIREREYTTLRAFCMTKTGRFDGGQIGGDSD